MKRLTFFAFALAIAAATSLHAAHHGEPVIADPVAANAQQPAESPEPNEPPAPADSPAPAESPEPAQPQAPTEPVATEPVAGPTQTEPQAVEPLSTEPLSTETQPGTEANPGSSSESDPNAANDDDRISDAERIAELTEAIESDQQQIKQLETELENPESEYSVAEREFRDLDGKLDEAKESLERASSDPNITDDQRSELESNLESISKFWKLAKDRFDLAIEDRKTLKEQLNTLKHKLQRDQKALNILTDGPEPEEKEADGQESDERRNSSSDNDDNRRNDSKDESDDRSDSSNDSSDSGNSDEEMSGESSESEEEDDVELKLAREEAEKKEAELEEAQEETRSIEARLKDLQLLIAQEQKELNIAKKKVDLANAAGQELGAELTKLQAEDPNASEIATLKNAIASANHRLIQARSEVAEINERLNDHRAELGSLQSEHIIALHEAEKKRQEAVASEQLVAELKNPYTLRNILQWLLEHGPRLAMIFLGMLIVNRVAQMLANRSVQLVSKGSMRGSRAERENRAKTLVGVFQNAASVGVFITGSLMILEELGCNITVLMGGVAVIGLAVAFGAQNLIKDYFYGFVMLLENQYMLNDTIRIGGVTGHVERITLRMTVLRDSGGIVHFIPNGTINSVSNETHGWSRAVCEVGINHNEDLEKVLELLNEVSQQLASDERVAPWLLDKPSEPSIENLGAPIVILKLSVKTIPNKQGSVKQEWLRRIKRSFEDHSIAAPTSEPLPLRKFEKRREAA